MNDVKIYNDISLLLKKLPNVNDGVVAIRKNKNNKEEVVVYAVLTQSIKSNNEIMALMLKSFGKDRQIFIVKITHLPLLENGNIDLNQLVRVPIIDDTIVQQALNEAVKPFFVDSVKVSVNEIKEIKQDVLTISEGISSNRLLNDFYPKPKPFTSQKNAYASGGELNFPKEAPKTLAESLKLTALKYPNKGIQYIDSNAKCYFMSYNDLFKSASILAQKLYASGLKPQDKIILIFNDHILFFQFFWACLLCNIVPATISSPTNFSPENALLEKIYTTWSFLDNCHIITSDDIYSQLHTITGKFSLMLEKMISCKRIQQVTLHEIYDISEFKSDSYAFFQLSAGSTGVPKCIIETNTNIIAHIHASKENNQYLSNEITLNWLPLDHVVPILTFHLRDVYLGYEQIHINTNLILENPLKWLDYLQKYKATLTWAPNFGFQLLNEAYKNNQKENWDLTSVKYFMNAGEQVTYEVMKKFVANFSQFGFQPNCVQPAFGMAEVATCMTYNNNFNCEGSTLSISKEISASGRITFSQENSSKIIDLGPPIRGVEIRITDNNDNIVAEGIIGNLQIRGNTVCGGYYNNIEAQADSFRDDGWFNTGDLGFIFDGKLFLTGRAKETIIIRGNKFYCYEIEEKVSQIDGVKPAFIAACSAIFGNSEEEQLIIFFVPKDSEKQVDELKVIIRKIKSKLTRELGFMPSYVIPLNLNDFPKTTSGKIQRIKLKNNFLQGKYNNLSKNLIEEKGIPKWFYCKKLIRKNLIDSIHSKEKQNLRIIFDLLGSNLKQLAENIFPYSDGAFIFINEDNSVSELKNIVEWLYKETKKETIITLLIPDIKIAIDNGDAQSIIFLYTQIIRIVKGIVDLGLQTRIRLFFSFILLEDMNCDIDSQLHHGLPAFINTIAREYEQLDTYFISLVNCPKEQINNYLVNEFANNFSDHEIYYVKDKRYVLNLAPVTSFGQRAEFIKKLGTYIIVGGLGGIGYELAKYLLEHYKIRLIIVGRTYIELGSEHEIKLKQLENINNKIRYIVADISNNNEVDCITDLLIESNEKPDGIIQMAGYFNSSTLLNLSEQEIYNGLAGKVSGTLNLVRILNELNPKGQLICFSSLIGLLGASQYSVYALGNGFLDSLCCYLAKKTSLDIKCLSWGTWDNLGMATKSNISKEALRKQGFCTISPELGLDSFRYALTTPNIVEYLGLSLSERIMSIVDSLEIQKQYLSIEVDSEQISKETLNSIRNSLVLEDQFGVQIPFNKIVFKTKSKTLDLLTKTANTIKIENSIINVWNDVFPDIEIKLNDDFFEFGCDSIHIFQLLTKINNFGYGLKVENIFDYPSVESLAKYITKINYTICNENSSI